MKIASPLALGLFCLIAPFAAHAQTPAPPAAEQSATHPATHTVYWFGVGVEPLPATIGPLLKLAPGQGLEVVRVMPESPAAKAGLLPGDLLIAMNRQPLLRPEQLIDAAQRRQTAKLEILREGNLQTITLEPAERPKETLAPSTQRRIHLDHGRYMEIGPGVLMDLPVGTPPPAPGATRTLVRLNGQIYDLQMILQRLENQQREIESLKRENARLQAATRPAADK